MHIKQQKNYFFMQLCGFKNDKRYADYSSAPFNKSEKSESLFKTNP
jgi:hypothetical protein